MKKIVYFCAFLICWHAQATIGNAVDFVNNALCEYNKEEPKPLQEVVVKQESRHAARALAGEFSKGVAITMVPQVLYWSYRIVERGSGKGWDKIFCAKTFNFNELATVVGMFMCGMQGVWTGLQFVASDSSWSDVIQCMTRFVGSLGTAGLLYELTCWYRSQ